jgi:peroxiredoxin
MKIQVGMEAPDFELTSHLDDAVRLSEYRGRHHVLVAFFPMAFTPV